MYPLKVLRCSPILQTTVPTHLPLWKAYKKIENKIENVNEIEVIKW
jgi:hypothetical protein